MGLEFYSQLHFLLRVIYLITLSVFAIKSSNILDVFTLPGISKEGWGLILSYIVSVYLYIPMLTGEFRKLYEKRNIQFYQVGKIAVLLADVFVTCFNDLDRVSKQAEETLCKDAKRQVFSFGDIILIWLGVSKVVLLFVPIVSFS